MLNLHYIIYFFFFAPFYKGHFSSNSYENFISNCLINITVSQFKTGLRNMVVIQNLYLKTSKKEHTITSNNFQNYIASTKHLILF